MNARGPVFVYGITDPRDGRPRYIGSSNNPKRRWSAHYAAGYGAAKSMRAWVRELRDGGHRPGLVILERVADGHDAAEREAFWIDAAQRLGIALLNVKPAHYPFEVTVAA